MAIDINLVKCKSCTFKKCYPLDPPCLICWQNNQYEQERITNADYIRQMTDEELAAWIWENDILYFTRKEDVKEWLREEYSNEEE